MVICGTFFFDLAQFLFTEKIGYATRYGYMIQNTTSILDPLLFRKYYSGRISACKVGLLKM